MSLMPTERHGYAAALQRAGVPVRSLNLGTRWDPRAAGRLTSVLEGIAPDVIHTHLKHADMAGSRAADRLSIPMVSSLHVVEDAVSVTGRFKRLLAMRARDRSAARIVAVSEALRRWYLGLSDRDPASVLVLRNGVPTPPSFPATHRSSMRTALGIPDDAVMAVTVAVLRTGKGIDDLLLAAATLPDDPDVRFVVAGSGPEEPRLLAEADRLGLLGDRVVFPGFIEDVAGLLAAADMLVHPSHADALATALIHGMAAGLPAVATDVGGSREIVDERHGVIVPAGDPQALATAIWGLASHSGRREGDECCGTRTVLSRVRDRRLGRPVA